MAWYKCHWKGLAVWHQMFETCRQRRQERSEIEPEMSSDEENMSVDM